MSTLLYCPGEVAECVLPSTYDNMDETCNFTTLLYKNLLSSSEFWKNVIFEWAHNSTENVESEGESANNYKPLFSNVY